MSVGKEDLRNNKKPALGRFNVVEASMTGDLLNEYVGQSLMSRDLLQRLMLTLFLVT
jgi:hypothetical protein